MSGQLSAVLPTWEELIDSPGDIDNIDIAIANLLAASGLPGAENLDIPPVLDKLDEWAHLVMRHTATHMHRFAWMKLQEQTEFTVGDSLARFCCYCMLEALQLKCGVRYNPKRKFSPNYCEPADVFIHGIVGENGEGGTCASMPVVYVAIGRRLGYPVYLNHTKGHCYFCWRSESPTQIEWESPPYSLLVPPDRFNIEGTGEGIAFPSDAHYIQWPHRLTAQDFEFNTYLRPQTQRESFAEFLVERAHCFSDNARYDEALKAIFNARRLCPHDERFKLVHREITKKHIQNHMAMWDSIWEMDEHARRGRKKAERARKNSESNFPMGRVVKIASGHPMPAWLPPGATFRVVPPDEADLPPLSHFPPGSTLKLAFGSPRPLNLPPFVQVQYVPANQADSAPWLFDDPHAPLDSFEERREQLEAQNRRLTHERDREVYLHRLITQSEADPIANLNLNAEGVRNGIRSESGPVVVT